TAGQPFAFSAAGALAVGSVDGVSGITTSSGLVSVQTAAGNLAINNAVNAGTAPIALSAGGAGSTLSSTATISNGGAHPIPRTADRMDLHAAITNTSTGAVVLKPLTPGLRIDLGAPSVPGTTFGLTDAELGRVTAGVLRLATTGAITVSGAVTRHAGYPT